MSDTDGESSRSSATKIPRFHGRRGDDYGLWRLRLRAACRVKGVWDLVDPFVPTTRSSDTAGQSSTPDGTKLKLKMEKASGMIIAALGDAPLRVVAEVDDDPAMMVKLLDARYASNRTVSRIAVQTQLYRMRYKDQDMSKYIDEYTALFSQLEFMGKSVAIPDAHKAPMLLASIDPTSEMESIAAALRTKDAEELTWEFVSTTLIDEFRARRRPFSKSTMSGKRKKKNKDKRNVPYFNNHDDESSSDEASSIQIATRALAAALGNMKAGNRNPSSEVCDFCERRGHNASNCFLNPDNPNNKLSGQMKERMMVANASKSSKKSSQGGRSKGSCSKPELIGMVQCSYDKKMERTTINPPKDDRTYHDSGATSHVYHTEDAFVPGSITECEPRTVLLADKSSIIASKQGEVILPFQNANIRLKCVLFIPGLGYNLVSVGRLADNGITSLFESRHVQLKYKPSGMIIGQGVRDDTTKLYALPDPVKTAMHTIATVKDSEAQLWHKRLAHMNAKDLCQVHKHAIGVPKLSKMNEICRACRLGKAHKLPFKGTFNRAVNVGDIVHSDIVGPLEPSYPDRYRYFATFQDDHSRYDFAGMMTHKNEVGDVFIQFAHRFTKLGSTPTGVMNFPKDHAVPFQGVASCIKKIHSDNAKEYIRLGNDLGGGIDKSYAPKYTPELNAVAERVNRTIEDASRSMLIQANLPTCLWPFAVKQVVYIRNRVAHSTTGETPYSMVTGEKPSLKNVRVFGCAAFVLQQPRGGKFDARAMEGVLLEVKDHGVYKVLVKEDSDTYSIVESRHVTFDESRYPGTPGLKELMDEEVVSDSTWCDASSGSAEPFTSEDENDSSEDRDIPPTEDSSDDNDAQVEDEDSDAEDDGDDDFQNADATPPMPPLSSTHRYPRRNRRPPGNWFMAAASPNFTVTTADDPTLKEAMNATPEERGIWLNAIDEEFRSIVDNETWEPDDAPKETPLPTHVVLNVKRNAHGGVDRFKARLVAGGNHQTYGLNYLETYAPVVEFSAVRLFLYLVLYLGLFVGQVDVKSAFLNGSLAEDVWVMSPRGIPGLKPRVYKLKKSLYGLKQAHLAWHTTLCSDLAELGFHELVYAPCVFRRKVGVLSFILVYVDDMLILSTTQEEVDRIVAELQDLYKLRRSEEIDLFLGVRLQWKLDTKGVVTSLHMSQKAYVESVLRRFGMATCKPAITPMVEKFFEGYDADEDQSQVNTELYQKMIGSLLYLALRTRPDILVSVLILARFQQKPTGYCLRAAKRVLRYLKGTSDYALMYTSGTCDLSVFVDSDYAGDTTDRKSTTGYMVKLGETLVYWGARKQASVARSTCEAEYLALSDASKEVLWLRRLLNEMGMGINSPTPLRSDNESAISWAVGSRKNIKRAKHIDVRVHSVRDLVAKKIVEVTHVSSEENDADMLTKPLGRVKLKTIMDRIWLRCAVEEEY